MTIRKPSRLFYAPVFAVLLLLAGCDSITSPSARGVRVRPELVRLGGASGHQSALVARELLLSRLPCEVGGVCTLSADDDMPIEPTGDWATSEIDLESFLLPITRIELRSSARDQAASIHRCDSDCEVELADPNFERNLLPSSSVEVPVGEYDTVVFGFCSGDAEGYEMRIKASVEVDGVRYYTKSNGNLYDTAPSEYIALQVSGCGEESRMPFSVVVEESEIWQEVPADSTAEGEEEEEREPMGEATLRLYFTTDNLVHLGFPANAGSCSAPEFPHYFLPQLCSSAPNVAGFLGDEFPEIEHYYTDVEAAFTLFLLNDKPMGGYVRGLASSDGHEFNRWRTMSFMHTGSIHTVRPNSDGSVYLEGSMTNTGRPAFIIERFERGDHEGEWVDFDNNRESYTAKRVR